jgi:hypothetical protein
MIMRMFKQYMPLVLLFVICGALLSCAVAKPKPKVQLDSGLQGTSESRKKVSGNFAVSLFTNSDEPLPVAMVDSQRLSFLFREFSNVLGRSSDRFLLIDANDVEEIDTVRATAETPDVYYCIFGDSTGRRLFLGFEAVKDNTQLENSTLVSAFLLPMPFLSKKNESLLLTAEDSYEVNGVLCISIGEGRYECLSATSTGHLLTVFAEQGEGYKVTDTSYIPNNFVKALNSFDLTW